MKYLDYIFGDRRGKRAHSTELEAMSDPFLHEAIEGFDTVGGDHAKALARLTRTINLRAGAKRRRRRAVLLSGAAAAAVLLFVATGGFRYFFSIEHDMELAGSDRRHDVMDSATMIGLAEEQTMIAFAEEQTPETAKSKEAAKERHVTVKKGIIATPEQGGDIAVRASHCVISENISDTSNVKDVVVATRESQNELSEVVIVTGSRSMEKSTFTGCVAPILQSGSPTAMQKSDAPARDLPLTKQEFYKYVAANRIALDIEGVVKVRFSTDPRGIPSGIKIIKSLSADADDEVIRLINSGPRWPASKRRIVVEIEF